MRSDITTAPWLPGPSTAAMSDAPPAIPAPVDDVELVQAARRGDTAAFDVLVTRHRRAVYQVCYRFVHQHEDAADLTQDTFVRAWKALDRFRGDARFSTWLHRIAVNVSLNRLSAKAPPTDSIDVAHLADASQPPPGESLDRRERAAIVRRAVAALPPRQRAALVLRTYHELSHQQIADLVGSSVGAVKANVFHALANLRRRLDGVL